MSERNVWDIVHEYPLGSLVVALSAIWAVERIVKTVVSTKKKKQAVAPLPPIEQHY